MQLIMEDLLGLIKYTNKMKVIVRGLKGYGIDYGIINPITCYEIESPLDKLGENVLYAL